jgi:hypothetical protein
MTTHGYDARLGELTTERTYKLGTGGLRSLFNAFWLLSLSRPPSIYVSRFSNITRDE